MKFSYPKFEVRDTETLEPDESRVGDIFSRLGYKIWDAIADLVDNSVDANASHVLTRFVRSAQGVHSVIIADDGDGMNGQELKEAMRFGSTTVKSGKQLGKYGIGLKSASLSQADVVTVLSKKAGSFSGRRWTLQNIKDGWKCEILDEGGIRAQFKTSFGDFKIVRSGTIIIWERLEHLRALPQNLDQVLENTINQLSIELGIRFHRFLEKKILRLAIDQQFVAEEEPQVQRNVTALNPFDYPVSGRPEYPICLKLDVNGTKVVAKCHIWPPKSSMPGYRLGGGKVAQRQGFYFYRNERVIQAGGWNGLKADDGEPHLSLARVEVDLDSALDSMFKLDVTKSTLDPSPQFLQALQAAAVGGVTFAKYLDVADTVYRKQKKKERARFPFVPGAGLPVRARKAVAAILSEEGTGRAKHVNFRWERLDHDEIVHVDSEAAAISLNSRYRRYLSEGGSNDAPVLKMVLMFLLQQELEKSFKTKKTIGWLQRINHALIAALKQEA